VGAKHQCRSNPQNALRSTPPNPQKPKETPPKNTPNHNLSATHRQPIPNIPTPSGVNNQSSIINKEAPRPRRPPRLAVVGTTTQSLYAKKPFPINSSSINSKKSQQSYPFCAKQTQCSQAINQRNTCYYKELQPKPSSGSPKKQTQSNPNFWRHAWNLSGLLPYSVSCLLSSVVRLLYPAVPSMAIKSVSIRINSRQKTTTRAKKHTKSTQNKPNLKNPKITTTLVTTKSYNQNPPQPAPKKQTQTNPIPARYDIQHTPAPRGTYEIRKTNPISKPPKPPQPLLPQRFTRKKPSAGPKKQTQSNPILICL